MASHFVAPIPKLVKREDLFIPDDFTDINLSPDGSKVD